MKRLTCTLALAAVAAALVVPGSAQAGPPRHRFKMYACIAAYLAYEDARGGPISVREALAHCLPPRRRRG